MDRTRRLARQLRNDMTDAERHLWRSLRSRQLDGFRFRRQVPIAGYIVDFVCPQAKLIVELDGGQHAEKVDYDDARSTVLRQCGYRVLRYWNDDALLRTDDVVADIYRELTKSFTPPQPSPSLRERKGATAEATGPAFAPSLSPQAKGRAGEGCS